MLYIWIILYGMLFTLSEAAAEILHAGIWLSTIVMTVYTTLLVLWAFRTGWAHQYGLLIPRIKNSLSSFFLPLALLPLCNLLITKPSLPAFPAGLLMFCICIVEEFFFRGMLLSFLVKSVGRWGIFLSAVFFSLFHLVNLASGMELSNVLMQTASALAAGLIYSIVRLSCGSLIPCIAAHFFTNITAGELSHPLSVQHLAIWMMIIFLHFPISVLLFPKINIKTEDNS